MNAIAVENMVKRYGSGRSAVQALAGVTLSVDPGEIYGLLGRNGAGKTTLVKILLDIVRPTSGGAWILGVPSRSANARRSLGYLPEDHRFPEYRTGESTLHFYARLSGMPATDRRRRVLEVLALVGLATAARRKVRGYSKGMKQRLGLAQVLVHDPDVLFLDEPTDGVDPVGRAEIRQILEQLKQRGKTILLNSHLLSEVEEVCDRVGILERGRLVREGSIDALTQAELVYQIDTTPLPTPELLATLATFASGVAATETGVELALRAEEDVDRAIDLFRAQAFGIRRLEGKTFSLEQVFLQAVDQGGQS